MSLVEPRHASMFSFVPVVAVVPDEESEQSQRQELFARTKPVSARSKLGSREGSIFDFGSSRLLQWPEDEAIQADMPGLRGWLCPGTRQCGASARSFQPAFSAAEAE